jgi:hypothetical protein
MLYKKFASVTVVSVYPTRVEVAPAPVSCDVPTEFTITTDGIVSEAPHTPQFR